MNSTNAYNTNNTQLYNNYEFLLYLNNGILTLKFIYQIYTHIKSNSKNNQLQMQSDTIKSNLSKIKQILKTLIRNNMFTSNQGIGIYDNINNNMINDENDENKVSIEFKKDAT